MDQKRAALPEGLRADLERYVRILEARFAGDLVSVVIFGSWARGTARAESDLDLLVVVRDLPGSRLERRRLFVPLARMVSVEFADTVAPVLLTPEEAQRVKPFYLGMLSGHEVLRDRDGYFQAVLAGLRTRLQALGSRRCVDDDGYEYWDLKPDWKPGDVVTL